MKKLAFIFVTILVLGFASFSNPANAAELKENENTQATDTVNLEDKNKDKEKLNAKIISIRQVSDIPIQPQLSMDSQFPISTLGAGTWDPLGTSTFKNQSKTFYSGGGDLLIYITMPYKGPGITWWYKLYEDDPLVDDTISYFQSPVSSGTIEVKFDVSNLPDSDGVSGKAELYLTKLTNPFDSVTTEWFD